MVLNWDFLFDFAWSLWFGRACDTEINVASLRHNYDAKYFEAIEKGGEENFIPVKLFTKNSEFKKLRSEENWKVPNKTFSPEITLNYYKFK